jgi:hypothetical protein
MDQPPIEDGAVAIEGDTIVAVGKAADVRAAHTGDVRDLGERVLAPGLINAHCHLDYTRLHDEVQWRGSFTEWLLQLVAAKQLHPEKEYLGGIQMGLDMLARSGTTTVVNIESFPRFIDQIPRPQLRVWWCLEMIDFNRPEADVGVHRRPFQPAWRFWIFPACTLHGNRGVIPALRSILPRAQHSIDDAPGRVGGRRRHDSPRHGAYV